MQQVIFIHGGKCFSSREGFRRALENRNCDFFCEEKKKWTYWLKEKLRSNYQYATPEMPLAHFASYEEWKLWFEKIFPQLNDKGTILI